MIVNTRLVVASSVASAILIGSAWAVYGVEDDSNTAIIAKTQHTSGETDSDKDGLPDWQERLIGTDPYSADSDKDGTSDAQEIKSNRNPLVKGPNDTLDLEDSATTIANKSLLGAYIGTDGTIKSGANPQEVAKTIITQGLNTSYKTYTKKDFIINDETSAKDYGNEVGKLIADNSFETDIFAVFSSALNAQDPAMLSALNEPITAIELIVDGLVMIEIPTPMIDAHIVLTNTFERLLTNIKMMQKLYTDPIGGTAGIKGYTEDVSNLNDAIILVGKKLKSLGVKYTADDYGFAFVDGL